jgi:hypothetical protein
MIYYVLVIGVSARAKNLGSQRFGLPQECTTADNFENWLRAKFDPAFENNNFSMVRRDYQESTIVP